MEKDSIRGDKLRDLILLVYLNNKYGLGTTIKLSKLKQFLSYSTGGLYNALDDSGYFIRKGDEITLSDAGERYARKNLMQRFRAVYPVGYFLTFFGMILIAHWYLLMYHDIFLFFDWTVGLSFILVGLLIRFALPPFAYWILKIRGKV